MSSVASLSGDETWLQVLRCFYWTSKQPCALLQKHCSEYGNSRVQPCANVTALDGPRSPPIRLLHAAWLISRRTPLTPCLLSSPQAPKPARPKPSLHAGASPTRTQPTITFKGNHLACAPGPFSLRYAVAVAVTVVVTCCPSPLLLLFTAMLPLL